jgi:ABC-type branched-subunit amino acid transport system substrate-binding protein
VRLSRRPLLAPSALLIAASLALTACSSNNGTTDTSPVTAGVLHAFTGQNAFFGLNAHNACAAAAQQINGAGGILGHNLTCEDYDTKGDPADAVPVTNRMLAAASHLVMVVGPDGNDIPSVLPLLEQSKVPELNTVGDPRYDDQTSQYFWRLTPSDSNQSPALAYYAYNNGFTKVAEVFTNDLSAQTTTGPFESKFQQLGGTIVKSVTLTAGAPSYQTEVAQVLAAHPQAIVGEMDTRTAATFLSQLQQQNGSLIPFISTQRSTQPDWAPAVLPVIGNDNMAKIVSIAPELLATGAAFDTFKTAMATVDSDPDTANNAFVAAQYDGVIALALAMVSANSIDPATFVPHILKVTAPSDGATVVHNYADGVAALKAGKTIQYQGATGEMLFDAHNTANRLYSVWAYDQGSSGWKITNTLPASASTP